VPLWNLSFDFSFVMSVIGVPHCFAIHASPSCLG
jgi:hypothetical protein